MRLKRPDAFLRAFGEYCFGAGAEPDSVDRRHSERHRLSRRFAWYETHLVNMLVDFVESKEARSVLPASKSTSNSKAGWVAAREQKHVDVALCPPFLQGNHKLEWEKPDKRDRDPRLNPHTPLYKDNDLWKDVIAIETKVIPSANWSDIWQSAFRDLSKKRKNKPPCDYLLACIHLFEEKRPAKAHWCYDACKSFAAREPGQMLKLQMTKKGPTDKEQSAGGAKIRYVARWPVDPGSPENPNMISTPHPAPKWNGDEWLGMKSNIFLVLLRRA